MYHKSTPNSYLSIFTFSDELVCSDTPLLLITQKYPFQTTPHKKAPIFWGLFRKGKVRCFTMSDRDGRHGGEDAADAHLSLWEARISGRHKPAFPGHQWAG